jgi:hypothetical protein
MMSHYERKSTAKRGLFLAVAVLSAVTFPASTRAQDKKTSSSLELIPADAAYYGAMLRNREQVNTVVNSKTWARIAKLPYVQMGLTMLKQQYEQNDDLALFRQWIAQDENRDLVELLTDAVSTDLFCYAAGNWVDFIDLTQQLYYNSSFAPFSQLIKDPQMKDQKAMQLAQVRELLRVLARNPNKIRVPDVIFGFQIKDAKKAEAQIKRLETLLEGLVGLVPILQGRLKRAPAGDSSFLTLSFDGEMVPWDEVNLKEFEEAAGEFEGVIKNLKKLRLTISLGVRHGFLLFAVGSTTEGISRLGGDGPRLTSRAELKPLVRAAGNRLTSISYSSKALAAQSQLKSGDIDKLATVAGHALDAAGVAQERRKAIQKDVNALAADLKKSLTTPGATLSFNYISERGVEGYDYEYGEFPDRDSSKRLTLLDHVGGDPILAVVGRSKGTLERYQSLSKWIKSIYGHAEPLVLEKLGEQEKQKYEEIRRLMFPLLKRGDEITFTMLLPSLADEQAGVVLDAKWKSKQWHPALPTGGKELPMPELAFLVGVSDRALLVRAVQSYRKLIEDALVLAKEHAPPGSQLPLTKVPEPEIKDVMGGTLYLWRPPSEAQLDGRVALTAGLSDKVALIALSAEHAERLLAAKPLKVEGGPLADTKRSLAGASCFNWPAFIDALSPWAMFALEQAQLEKVLPGGGDKKDDADAQKKQREEIIRHVRAILNALKAIRGSTSATYIENGALITHSEVVIRDE